MPAADLVATDHGECVSQLFGDIYDAALDPQKWSGVLEKTCAYVEGAASVLISHDSAQTSAQFHYAWGDDPEYGRRYEETCAKLKPTLISAVTQTRVGEVSAYSDLRDNGHRGSRFYKEWAGLQGCVDAVQVTLEKSATSFAAVEVVRHKRHGIVDASARRRMAVLAPHFRRALAIAKTIDWHKAQAAPLADTLDSIAAGIFLVDAEARIVHANVSGEAMLDCGTVMRARAGRLSAMDPKADQVLREVFAAAGGDGVGSIKNISVPLGPRDAERWVAHVLPLTSGARRQVDCHAAVSAVFLRTAALELPGPLQAISSLYKLTPAELRVLMAIVEVGGVPDVAPALGVSETTVKTHLQRIFDKTGTKRQADVVKLIAAFTNPLGLPTPTPA